MGPSIGRGGDEAFSGPEARYTFANFVVGKPNEFAYAAARAAPAERDHRRAARAVDTELPAADAAHGTVDRPRRRKP